MILFLFGKDTFRSQKKLREIINSYRLKYKSGLNLKKLEADEESFEELRKNAETLSMFQEKKLFILKNIFLSPKTLQEKLEKYLSQKKIYDDKNFFLLIFENNDIKNRTKNNLYKFLFKKSYKKQEFKELSPAKIKEFIKEETASLGGKISEGAVGKISFYFENNLWAIESEIKKLVSFKRALEIKATDVENLCEANINPNIFSTIEATSKKDKKTALKLISKHVESGENEIKILTMIAYQFRNLLKIRSLVDKNENIWQIQKIAKMHPFVVKKNLPLAQNFKMKELKEIYKKIFDLDLKIKTGKIEPKMGIELFIADL